MVSGLYPTDSTEHHLYKLNEWGLTELTRTWSRDGRIIVLLSSSKDVSDSSGNKVCEL